MPKAARLAAIEHLANVVYRLFDQRKGMNVTSYFRMTYLAVLYTGTAVSLAGHAADVGFDSPEMKKKVENLSLNVDELGAHNGPVTFLAPAMFFPGPLLQWLRTRRRADDPN